MIATPIPAGPRERMLDTILSSMGDLAYSFDRDGRLLFANRQLLELWGRSAADSIGLDFLELGYPTDLAQRLQGQVREVFENGMHVLDETPFTGADGTVGRYEYMFSPAFAADGSVDFVVGSARDVSGRRKAAQALHASAEGLRADIHALRQAQLEVTRSNAALQQQRAEHRVLFDLMPAMIWFKDTANRILRVNQRVADAAGLPIEQIEGRPSAEIYPLEAAAFHKADLQVIHSRAPMLGLVELLHDPQGAQRWVQTDKVPYFDDAGKVIGIVVMSQDVTERRRAELEIERSHSALREVSRRAGMSEVATNVLHNVGNVLNSVNVSAGMMVEALDASSAGRMAGVVALLRGHFDALGPYLTDDPKGRHIPAMLEQLSADWNAQQEALRRELESLRGNVDHIKQIVAMQQAYARVVGNSETLSVTSLIEEALAVKQPALVEDGVRVVRDFGDVPPIEVEKHRVLQILVNLIRNSKVACNEQGAADKCITVRTALVDGRLRISVADNGSGIARENLTRVFAHGFTTRRDGHGFGLHSGALAAAELGGSLSAASDGPGLGATFTLDLPLQSPKVPP